MTDRELELEDALTRILQWTMAYPIEIFSPITAEQFKLADELLRQNGISMSGMHASWARHLVGGIGSIARQSLEEKT